MFGYSHCPGLDLILMGILHISSHWPEHQSASISSHPQNYEKTFYNINWTSMIGSLLTSSATFPEHLPSYFNLYTSTTQGSVVLSLH